MPVPVPVFVAVLALVLVLSFVVFTLAARPPTDFAAVLDHAVPA
jgi:hypothetical protein